MEKERGYKVVAIVALLLAVVGVGIGFAAFSATFTINEETVTVNPSENLLEANMRYIKTEKQDPENIVTNMGTFTNNTWGGVTFAFNETFDTEAMVQAEIKNESNYDVYLTRVYSTTNGSHTPNRMTECVAEEGTNEDLVNGFCFRGDYFEVYVGYANVDPIKYEEAVANDDENLMTQVLRDAGLTTSDEVAGGGTYLTTNPADLNITGEVKIPAGKSIYVFVSVTADFVNRTVTFPDGPFKIYIPEVHFDFSTAKPVSR